MKHHHTSRVSIDTEALKLNLHRKKMVMHSTKNGVPTSLTILLSLIVVIARTNRLTRTIVGPSKISNEYFIV